MAETLRINDFSQGWIPSDDVINGRKNGLLVMDNLELDRNGALSLTGGAAILRSYSGKTAHDLYSRYIGATRYDYVATYDSLVYRNSQQIISGGDSQITAFGTAFNYVLIASGNQRVKDNGNTTFNLGIQVPSVAPTVTGVQYQTTTPIACPAASAVINQYGSTITYSALGATVSQDGNFTKINYDTSGVSPAAPNNAVISFYGVTPLDWTTFPDGSHQTDNDYMNIDVMGFGTLDARFTGMTIDVILQPGQVSGPYAVTDYYSVFTDGTETWANLTGGDTWNFQIPRSAFIRVGNSSAGWESVYSIRITFNCQDTTRTFAEIFPHGNATTIAGFCFVGGNASQDPGWWQFAQMNVRNDGTYLAKSQLGPATGLIPILLGQAVLTLQTPTDSQVNQVWVFARSQPVFGGSAALENWMCVAQLTNLTNLTGIVINFSIADATALGIQANTNLISIASSSITDKIVSIVGPIHGRWFYFTQTFLYPSDVNDPDIVDASLAIRISGSTSEIVLWAVQVSDSIILVGTSVDIYILTGTFVTLPDGSVDVYYRPLGVKFPPITYDVTVFNGIAYYYATDGWRSIKPTSENINITTPNIDRLYRNELPLNIYNYYPGNTRFQPGQLRAPCTTALNKFWGAPVQANVLHIYDFARQYWRPYGFNDFATAFAITSTQDGHILLFTGDGNLWDINLYNNKQFNGSNASFDFLTPVFDGGEPYKRKENYCIKLRCYTGGSGTVNVMLIKDDGTFATVQQNIASNVIVGATGPLPQEIFFDINTQTQFCKTWQFYIWGTVADFIFSDIEINYDLRPQQLTSFRILNQNFGTASPKRMRDWPVVIDTMGNEVFIQIAGDGTLLTDNTVQTVNTPPQSPLTVHNFINVDLLATDYSMYINGGPFELHKVLPPDIVQTLPLPRLFDQVGPDELFQFGRIKKIEIRLYAGNNTRIPYTLYFNDNSVVSSTIVVVPNKEASYFLGGFKESGGGEIVRIEFGGNTLTDPFYRYYVRLQVQKTGQDTELTWVQLPNLIGRVYGSEFEQQ